ncbi:MAG: L-ribulose-5-phosphate 4-epimerase AraD [Streptococcaceae bacterium]|jgi:L-ribulose-5-phosphate 4-epimerase|nr:L-ribulose-5-phosphate 4-epimerase AraD [Streptococcaceae bacterium]
MNRKSIIRAMKQRVYDANIALKSNGLVVLTWGNVSEINREEQVIVIKPSGVDYDVMQPEDMVLTDLKGNLLEEKSLNPSSDLATHVKLYQEFTNIQSVVHTHSDYAVAWAQANRDIPTYGTTHADTFYGSIPVTRQLDCDEVNFAYEEKTGQIIVETFKKRNINPNAIPGVVVLGHGPFTWGESPKKAVENSIVLNEVAKMAMMTEMINNQSQLIPDYLLDKHYFRKHGENAYYGQVVLNK